MAKEKKVTEEKKETKKKAKDYIHEVAIKIEGEDWEKALDKAFKKKQKDAKVDGFRKGKVPRDIYEKHFGKESLFIDAADNLLQESYEKAIEESKLIPVVQPAVDLKSLDEKGVEFIFKIITKPELKIKKYQEKIVPTFLYELKNKFNNIYERFVEEYPECLKIEMNFKGKEAYIYSLREGIELKDYKNRIWIKEQDTLLCKNDNSAFLPFQCKVTETRIKITEDMIYEIKDNSEVDEYTKFKD